jgi:hypothetical protein
MRVIVQNVEYYVSMRDQPFIGSDPQRHGKAGDQTPEETLRNSLWIFDGSELRAWADMDPVLKAISGESTRELPPMVPIPVDFYPLSTLLGKSIVLGVESDLVQRRDVSFSFFRFSIRVSLMKYVAPPHFRCLTDG